MITRATPVLWWQSARNLAIVVGCAALGAATAARASPQCEYGPPLELRVTSVTVDLEKRDLPTEELRLNVAEGADVDANFEATVYDPDTGDTRRVELSIEGQ